MEKLLGARAALLEPAVRAVKSVCKLTRTSDERVLHPYDEQVLQLYSAINYNSKSPLKTTIKSNLLFSQSYFEILF